MDLPFLQLIELHNYEELHYEKPHCAIIVLCAVLYFRFCYKL